MLKIFKSFSKNKKALFFAVGLGLILFSLTWQYAEADLKVKGPDGEEYMLCEGCGPWPHQWPNCIVCFVKYIASLPIRIIFAAIVGIIGLGALVAGLLYAVIAAIVNWLIGVIMTVGIVPGNPLTPEIVEIGWNFSRDFANLFFILALAFIGLATVLRIREYEAKKALPTLIIIALLINFTPVIVGFVVDVGNIITKFFLDSAGSIDTFGDTINMAKDYLVNSLARLFLEDGHFWENFVEIILKFIFITVYGLVLLVFFIFATFIYLLIGAVFLFRTVILWILMILSPIAFLSKVFPAGKTTKMVFPDILHWDKWWETLIQWTVVGIPIGFFLYLSNLIMSATHKAQLEGIFDITLLETTLEDTATTTFSFASADPDFPAELSALQSGFVDLFVALFAPTIAIVLLGMGALISLKAAPEGAKGIIRFTHEKGVKRAWPAIRGGVVAVGLAPKRAYDAYKAQRILDPEITRRAAFGRVIRQSWQESKRAIRQSWQRRPEQAEQQPSTVPGTSAPPTTPTTTRISHTEEIEGQEEASGEEFIAPTPPAPSVSRKKRIAKWVGKWGALVPAKIGARAAIGILRATENMAKKKIDKELKAQKTKEQKTCSNPICREEIPANAKFCPECGQPQP